MELHMVKPKNKRTGGRRQDKNWVLIASGFVKSRPGS